jgi:alanine racemase
MTAAGHDVSIEKLRSWCNAQWQEKNDEQALITELVTDSRKITEPEGVLFIPLPTSRRDGHEFMRQVYERGVRNFLVSREVNVNEYPGANILKVNDTHLALQLVAAAYRKQFNIPVIGITGSNGKTIVKEWLYQLLNESYKTVRSPKSYNSQIGVPFSVWLMNEQHQLAIFEAGLSQPGEMEKLERIIQPTIGLLTNIGEAHSEGFLNQRQKINEKLILFRHAQQLVYCSDHPDINDCIGQYIHLLKGNSSAPPLKLFTWSQKHEADLRIANIEREQNKSHITALYKGENIDIIIPFTDPASVENAVHCWCILLILELPQDVIRQRMLQLQPVSMRMELRYGINDCSIIDDTYNSDLTSLKIALDYLDQQKQHIHHTVIMSDMLQIAKPDGELYDEVAELVHRHGIQRFIGIGPALYKHKKSFRQYKKLRSIFFKSTEDFLKQFHLLTFDKEAILLKGARSFTFEKIGKLLEQEVHQTVLSIDMPAMLHNLNVFRSLLGPGVRSMAMVKAFSYGSGSHEIAQLLQYAGVDYLSVAYIDEGVTLRKAGITAPIMVMSPDAVSFDRMIAWKLEPEIFNLRSLELFTGMARTLQAKEYPIHIKLDTGMHRLGFTEDEIPALVAELQRNRYVRVASIFSHLAASEDANQDDFTREQSRRFEAMSKAIMQVLPYKPLRHIANSAAIARHKDLHYDMVRLGLGLYGIDGSGALQKKLKQIGTLKTTIAQIKNVRAGESVGYGRRFRAEADTRIATISIGYADGYPRNLGNGKAHVLLHGKEAKVTGVVCMDMCMIDISHIPEAKEGDEVIVFGAELPITQIADWAETIPYEIMTGISQRVKRVYVSEE